MRCKQCLRAFRHNSIYSMHTMLMIFNYFGHEGEYERKKL